jgi:hypothetical protein
MPLAALSEGILGFLIEGIAWFLLEFLLYSTGALLRFIFSIGRHRSPLIRFGYRDYLKGDYNFDINQGIGLVFWIAVGILWFNFA